MYSAALMLNKELIIVNKLGLHARAAAKFVALTAKFASHIDVTKNELTVNGKSIMGIMTLAAARGTSLQVSIDGEDEQDMWQALHELVQQKFGEDE